MTWCACGFLFISPHPPNMALQWSLASQILGVRCWAICILALLSKAICILALLSNLHLSVVEQICIWALLSKAICNNEWPSVRPYNRNVCFLAPTQIQTSALLPLLLYQSLSFWLHERKLQKLLLLIRRCSAYCKEGALLTVETTVRDPVLLLYACCTSWQDVTSVVTQVLPSLAIHSQTIFTCLHSTHALGFPGSYAISGTYASSLLQAHMVLLGRSFLNTRLVTVYYI
jgi:hypothetical protein